ncbi:MAG TPA: ABC transporter permease [Jatrophihabitans sp.]|jgi:lipooligosaccharide transport system permease protein|nr:ABC transporter permease [Jatrophihabitans sp.]
MTLPARQPLRATTGHLVRPNGGGQRALYETFYVVDRRYIRVSVLTQLMGPILYLLSLGVGLGSVVNHSGSTLGVAYLAYIAPALIVATALQVGANEATYPILYGGFKYQQAYFAMHATPMTPSQISRGVLGWVATKCALSALFYLIVVACFGGIRSIGALLCIPIGALGAMALSAPIAAYSASIYKDGGSFPAIMRFIVMPMFLFSGTFYPVSSLPEWAHWAAWVSPLWHATELARWVSLGPLHLHSGIGQVSIGMVAVHLIYLSVLTVGGMVVTGWRFKVRLEK